MTLDPERTLRMTRRFAASPERVFDAWVRPEIASRWLFVTPADQAYTADLDAQVGGQWRITARRGGIDYTAVGEYRELERPRRIVFTFAMPQFAPDIDQITIELAPDGAGGCMLTLIQEGLLPEAKEATEQGWSDMFELLAVALG